MLNKGEVGVPGDVAWLHDEGLIGDGDEAKIKGLDGRPDGNVDEPSIEKVFFQLFPNAGEWCARVHGWGGSKE